MVDLTMKYLGYEINYELTICFTPNLTSNLVPFSTQLNFTLFNKNFPTYQNY